MGRSLTNNTSINYAIEETLGVLPSSPIWKETEPNAINAFTAEITTVPRDPISRNRQRRKGAVTDLDSTFEYDADMTMDVLEDFIRFFLFARAQGPILQVASPNDADLYIKPSATTTTAYTIPTVAAGSVLDQNTLVLADGFTNAANNGLKVVDTGATVTSVPITGGGLVVETPADQRNVTLAVAGFRFAEGDLEVNADGNLITTTKDFTELGLVAGQAIWIGGENTANKFDEAANFGSARVVSVATNLLTIENQLTTFVTDDGATKNIDIYFGPHIRNVPVGDTNFFERSVQFEGVFVNLNNPSGDVYRYSEGNYFNTMAIEAPLTNKSTITFGFVGTDTEPGTTTRATNAANARRPVKTSAFNTSSDIARLRIAGLDNTGLTTDFKSVTLTINNNVSPEKVLGTLGARFMNFGNFEIDIEAQLLFTDIAVSQAIRDNTTQMMDFMLRNDDGGVYFDLPEVTLGGGGNEFPVNESILINTTVQSHGDATYNASLMVTLFPYLPPIV